MLPRSREPSVRIKFVRFGNQAEGDPGFGLLLNSRASPGAFLKWFLGCDEITGLSGENWMRLVPPVAQAVTGFEWMTESDRWIVQRRIFHFVVRAFTILWRPGEHKPYRELLGRPSHLVRAAAALSLGRVFFGVKTEAKVKKAPPLRRCCRRFSIRRRSPQA